MNTACTLRGTEDKWSLNEGSAASKAGSYKEPIASFQTNRSRVVHHALNLFNVQLVESSPPTQDVLSVAFAPTQLASAVTRQASVDNFHPVFFFVLHQDAEQAHKSGLGVTEVGLDCGKRRRLQRCGKFLVNFRRVSWKVPWEVYLRNIGHF